MDFQLINCPVCGNKCSSQASTCPSCGHPFIQESPIKTALNNKIKTTSEKLQNQSKGSRNWMIATFALAILAISVLGYAVSNLYSDSKNPRSVFGQQKAANQGNNLTIKAALVYSFGGAQPAARTNFYLLNKNLDEIVQKAGIDIKGTPLSLDITADELQSKLTNKPSSLMLAMKPYIVRTATTDFEGIGTFSNVPTGDYFIYGRAQTRSGWAIWSLPFNISGTQTVLLDQNNALSAE